MQCDCGGRTYVVNTRQHSENRIRRQRKCEKCREWFYSIEVRELVPLKEVPEEKPKPMAKVAEKVHRKKVEVRRKLEDIKQERKFKVPSYFIEEEDY
jgi:transcriptional regulator NrdR family protein